MFCGLLAERRGGRLRGVAVLVAAAAVLPARLMAGGESPAGKDAAAPVSIAVFPADMTLDSPRRTMRLIITGTAADGAARDLTRAVSFVTNAPGVATVEEGVVVPRGDGAAEIRVSAAGQTAVARVRVRNFTSGDPVSFRTETLAALTKQGCNAGACHGSPSGKGGFRLSLRGFDAEVDRLTLLREAEGRRVNLAVPADSLVLLKPTMQVPHGGGQKLRTSDEAFAVLSQWIAEGCRIDPADAPRCTTIEVFPPRRVLGDAEEAQQFVVLGRFSDGTVRDVTSLADFSSSDEQVVTISPRGLAAGHERGEAVVVVRYLEHITTAPITRLKNVAGFRWTDPPASNVIDRLVFAQLRQLQIPPSELCTDGEFLRRLFLDVLGVLPTTQETAAFLADKSPEKRSRLVDAALARPEFAELRALQWGDLLRLKASRLSTSGMHKFHYWLLTAMKTDMPYDRFARTLLTADGSTFDNPPAAYFRTSADPAAAAETTAQLFLGLRIQCAKCHNHPHERWTQDNYYGLGAVFSRVQKKEIGERGEMLVYAGRSGEVTHPRTGRVMPPVFPLKGEVPVADDVDRRAVFAGWLTAPDNPFFAKVGVNRIWGHLFGRGIVEPVDDFRESNPPSNGPLLDDLTQQFVGSGYDARTMYRLMLSSRVYQLSSRADALNAQDEKHFSHARSRLLPAEQLLDAISSVTGVPEKFAGLPPGTRATQLPSPDVRNDFLQIFGRPSRETACECERAGDPKLTHAIKLISGEAISSRLQNPQSRLSLRFDDSRERLAAAGSPLSQNLVLWLKADAGALNERGAGSGDGDAVSQWQDQSNREHHAAQASPAQQPKWVARGPSGLPALRFRAGTFLSNAAVDLVSAGGPRTAYVVGQADAAGPGGVMFCFRRSNAGGLFSLHHGVVAGNFYIYSDGVNGTGNSTIDPATMERLHRPFVTTFLSPGAGQKLGLLFNGEPMTVTQPGAVGVDGGTTGFTVGHREDQTGPEYFWKGDLSEILVYDRLLSADEQAATGAYLATKYDLPAKWPKRTVAPRAEGTAQDGEILTDLYLAALCRYPTEDERKTADAYLRESPDRRRGLEDLYWAVLNSDEFLFQH